MAVVTATVAHKRHQCQAILCEIFKVKSLRVCVRMCTPSCSRLTSQISFNYILETLLVEAGGVLLTSQHGHG